MAKKDWSQMTRKELLALPRREWKDEKVYDFIRFCPAGTKHESGFSHIAIIGGMKNVEEKMNEAVEIAAFPDDVGFFFSDPEYKFMGSPRMDCGYPNGVFRMWSYGMRFYVGPALSSVEIRGIKIKQVKIK